MAVNRADLPLVCSKMRSFLLEQEVSAGPKSNVVAWAFYRPQNGNCIGWGKSQHCSSQLLAANFVQVRDSKNLFSYLFAIAFQGLLEIWLRGCDMEAGMPDEDEDKDDVMQSYCSTGTWLVCRHRTTESLICSITECFGWKGTLKLIFRGCIGKIEFFLFSFLHWNL